MAINNKTYLNIGSELYTVNVLLLQLQLQGVPFGAPEWRGGELIVCTDGVGVWKEKSEGWIGNLCL